MPEATTRLPAVPAPILSRLADLTEEALAVLQALDRFDFDEAERLRVAVEVLARDLDGGEFHDWVDATGLRDLLTVMVTIKEWARGFADGGEDRRIGPSDHPRTSRQLAELVDWIGRNVAGRRLELEEGR